MSQLTLKGLACGKYEIIESQGTKQEVFPRKRPIPPCGMQGSRVRVTELEQPTLEVHHFYSSIAQSVERMTVNHDVTGSSPVRGATVKTEKCLILNTHL